MSTTDDTNATRRGSESNDLLGQRVPQDVLDLIGWYGSSHANGESETLRLWRWQELLTGIKAYAAMEVAAERERRDALHLQALEELHQLGYTVRDGRLYPPEDSAAWDALADAALRRREKERLMGGVL